MTDLQGGRIPCPKCGRKGLGFSAHPHAFGWKDYKRASCRYCDASFDVDSDAVRAALAAPVAKPAKEKEAK